MYLMRSVLIGAGILLIMLGFVLIFAGLMSTGSEGVQGGGVIMVGPIPIIFGSNRRMAILAAALAVALMVLWFAFFLFNLKR